MNITKALLFLFLTAFAFTARADSGDILLPIGAKIAYQAKVNGKLCQLYKGRLYVDGKYTFLKTGKPLRNFGSKKECERFIAEDLPVIKKKGFNNLVLNCYWHQFDSDGNGTIDVDTAPLRAVIDKINELGMFASIAVETYGVGGGTIPKQFFKKFPNAIAIDSTGKKCVDDEYGMGTVVPSLFDKNYLKVARLYIANLARALSDKDILNFESTVEPQYIGNKTLDFSPAARKAYREYIQKNSIPAADMPEEYPVSREFLDSPVFRIFLAENLGDWVSQDIKAFKDAYKKPVFAAVDYLDALEETMPNRMGNPEIFLASLKDVQIIQVNWSWHLATRSPNAKAYARVRAVNRILNRNWAISEHMTLNGSDFKGPETAALLKNTIKSSTNYGWDFTDIFNKGRFCVYENNWRPKDPMKEVDDNFDDYLAEIYDTVKAKTDKGE